MSAESLFKIYVDLTNSERQAIWARNGTLLFANVLAMNAIVFAGSRAPELRPTLCYAGIGLCVLWAALAIEGWRYFYKHMRATFVLGWPEQHLHPFREFKNRGLFQDTIFLLTMLLIAGVIAIYVIILRLPAGPTDPPAL